jgi:hypothetical protein
MADYLLGGSSESIYQGVDYTTMSPSYYTSPIKGHNPTITSLGASLDPRTANQLGAVNLALNPGVKHIEVQGLTPDVFQSIPDQHLDEIRRQAKLAGAQLSLHGQLAEASGVGEGGFTEENRLGAEKTMEESVMRGHKLDPKGNISVTFHTSASLPDLKPHIKTKDGTIEQGLYIINEESGQITMIKPEKRYFPEEERKEGEKFKGDEIKFEAKKELERRNEETWTETLSGINRYAEFGEDVMDRFQSQILQLGPGVSREELPEKKKQIEKVIQNVTKAMAQGDDGKKTLQAIKTQLGPNYEEAVDDAERAITHSQIYFRDSYRNMKSLFDKAWKNTKNDSDREKLKQYAEEVAPLVKKGIQTDPAQLNQLGEIVQKGLKTLSDLKETPQMWQPLDEFTLEKSSQTFANVAEKAYDEFGSTAPIINIENPPANQALSSGEDLKKVVEKSREELQKSLIKNKGLSKSQAKSVAENMIGATWDVGHINMMKKKGYTDKDLLEQTKAVAPLVKHVHLSDNFGLEHTELPMGMGNVPLTGMMKELKKAGFEGKQIIEAGNWWQHFAEHGGGNPFKPSIEAFDSPIYTMASGPSWSEAGTFGHYYSGHGAVNPPIHHNTYGAGFQNMPVELGGEIPGGDRGRFAGS